MVEMKGEDSAPMDIRSLASQRGSGEISSLTGTSKLQSCSCDFAHDNPLETNNTGFTSISYLEGTATGMVTNTSFGTVMDRLPHWLQELEMRRRPLTLSLSTFLVLWQEWLLSSASFPSSRYPLGIMS